MDGFKAISIDKSSCRNANDLARANQLTHESNYNGSDGLPMIWPKLMRSELNW